ncbi:uracil phosphoribosyltransferase [Photobacterium galatheae]|uniref:Uracil phosphoribosyltransferase n=1 Tax=Photobacterium galatheae TaxID=1654360 RepID=A0A066S045_9GAMM|nr:uracil phosphoribosyltransferase [Photobacterium galatheae]KDM93307.1 uracil phosphoribosyltransferase [Photobacterium galatheae]MCM0150431.1 uracil phosphoribosyltransferase [Photobacterium galatheae]
MSHVQNVHVLAATPYLTYLHSKIRDKRASQKTFNAYSDQVIRQLLVKAAELLPFHEKAITTPVGDTYHGCDLTTGICGVSVIRAGESMEPEYNNMFPGSPIGKILIQRDKVTKLPSYFYSHFPADIAHRSVFLFEPMLATGGSLIKAIETLLENQVPEQQIIVVNFLASPEGLDRVITRFPNLKIVTSSIEKGMNEHAFMKPGIGDFGDRYFGTYAG